MRNKEILLGVSLLGSMLVVLIKYTEFVDIFRLILRRELLEIFFNTLLFFPVILFFSLLTYKLPQTASAYWWKFARWGIPVVFALVILINLRLHHSPGGWMNLDTQIDSLLVLLLYGLFIIGSAVSIFLGCRLKTIKSN